MPEHLIDVDGGYLTAFTYGSGPAVLFLHGWALDQRMWASQLRLAASGCTIITVDRRGFGTSTAPPNINLEVDDIRRLLDTLGFESAALVGMSQGGRVALRFACAWPRRVDQLALQGAPVDGFPSAPSHNEAIPIAHYRRLLQNGEQKRFVEEWCAHPLVAPDMKLMPRIMQPLVAGYEGRDLLHGAPDAYTGDVYGQMAALPVQTLYLYGEQDIPWLRSVAVTLPAVWRKVLAVEIKGAGHFANITKSDDYNAALVRFLGH
ncbi:alpha/beta fold hydrolase [Kordiimonas aestuarii]|uniref:alpha/beta fold hydrolase n=1 Tax=Kordiimonas aestuarii TaxID=1005925 RepID=UPI0021CE073C|nr:alpha/beta hydrolase [Kordiimonas aestuarii]